MVTETVCGPGVNETFKTVVHASAWNKEWKVDYCRNSASRFVSLEWVRKSIEQRLNDGEIQFWSAMGPHGWCKREIQLRTQWVEDDFRHWEIWSHMGPHGWRKRGHIYWSC